MREWPESHLLIAFLSRVRRLRLWQAATNGAAAGLAVAAPIVLALHLRGLPARIGVAMGLGMAAVGALIAWARLDRTADGAAAAIEAQAPQCRNVVITAATLLQDAGPTPAAVCRVVVHDAAAAIAPLRPSALLPWMPAARRMVGAALLFASTWLAAVPGAANVLPGMPTSTSFVHIEARISPPAYTGLAGQTVVDPERLTAQAGSRLQLRITGVAARMSVDTAAGAATVTKGADGEFSASITVDADGFVAITPFDESNVAGPRRLIGIASTPDRPPAPRVTVPGKDLFLREATQRLTIAAEATDDIGLRTLTLAYTKVAGVGESFTFTEGQIPLALTRTSARQWSGSGTLDLAGMSLEVGDMIVYRAVASDGRPGSPPVESDAFMVEIVSENEAMADGFAIDDTRDKYALSQQMVIVKTERLLKKAAGRPAPSRGAVVDEALAIAAEQRSVRAELVFMTGGEFEDEAVEAAHEHEISDGRMDNSGRADLGRAIREMSRASTELTEGNISAALDAEKTALAAMQRALSRRRFILRTLTQREAIDDTRRLTGALGRLAGSTRQSSDPGVPITVVALRRALSQLGQVGTQAVLARAEADMVTQVAADLLQVASNDRAMVDVVALLSRASEAMTQSREADARTALAEAARRITALLREAAPSSTAPRTLEQRRLRGALSDIERRGGGR